MTRTAAVSVAALSLAGGAVALAPSASAAVGKSGCSSITFNASGFIQRAQLVNLRSGPGTSYSSYGLVSNGTRLTYICYKSPTSSGGRYWAYVKITSGAHAGTYGWVDRYYTYYSF
ncbi:SH3 domain-containing protein [Streptomyces flaveolus]|uniref:SH3 domain-containing protein n=1 Tax=Streptomyces flaveolus TaxID=67297 RepID=UPI0036F84348